MFRMVVKMMTKMMVQNDGRAVDASIFNLTTSCVVFVNHVGGHFGDHLDHHSKHLHSVPAVVPSFCFDYF